MRDIEEERYPREFYWDVFASRTRAVALHLEDDPVFSAFDCPDGSHIDVRDAPAFTSALAQLVRRNLPQ